MTHLSLENSKISKNVEIVLVKLQGIGVTFSCFFIVFIGTVQKTVNMPTYNVSLVTNSYLLTFFFLTNMRSQILQKTLLDIFITFFFFLEIVQEQTLHGHSFYEVNFSTRVNFVSSPLLPP